MQTNTLSVIIPTLNEEANIVRLLERLDTALTAAGIRYEAVFIDDHSTDATQKIIRKNKGRYPVFLHKKQGERGKAQSLLEGFIHARYENIAILDADLQYPPEALPQMVEKLGQGFDVVVANREAQETTFTRRILSRGFALVFSKFLHGLNCDVQAGMKVFRRQVVQEVKIDPTPWTFDLEFLLLARHYGYTIGSVSIPFVEREAGESKIIFTQAVFEIGLNALKLRFKRRLPFHLPPEKKGSMVGAGVAHDAKRFVTHTTLHHQFSAVHTFAPWHIILFWIVVAALAIGFFQAPLGTAIVVVGCLSVFYFLDMFFNLFLVMRSLKDPPEIRSTSEELALLDQEDLPLYSILCPLYKEVRILPHFVAAIEKLDWPKEKLDVTLLLEENDEETIEAAREMNLPEYMRILIVPHSFPKTKPKACNYGLNSARGEYVVIYDAEDIPDPLQLKKAYLGFRRSPENVRCLQAKLNYFNPHQNLLTRLFAAEYSLWFDVTLPGLQSINTSIPLGGTSNHFRTKDLLDLEGWDPFNVTEDCDLGVRIFKRGFQTAIIDSVTLEEANSSLGNWIRQRSRWIKGYMQTYLVHMRHPLGFIRENGVHAFLFQLIVGGKIATILINPFLWLMTISYFALNAWAGPAIEALYPSAIFYLAVTSLVFGNFLAIYYYMVGCAKREHWSVMKYVFFVPFYWLLVSIAAGMALYQLFFKPHYWEKTQHGLHLKQRRKLLADIIPAWMARANQNKAVPKNPQPAPGVIPETVPVSTWEKVLSVSSRKTDWRKWKKLYFSSEGVYLQILLVSSAVNFLFNAYLGRVLGFEEFALVAFINTLWYFAMIFLGAFFATVNHEAAYAGATRRAVQSGWLRYILGRGLFLMGLVSVVWIMLVPFLAHYFKTDPVVLYLFTPAFTFGLMSSANRGYIQGKSRFVISGCIVLIEAVTKLIFAGLFVGSGHTQLAYLAIPISIIATGLASFFFIRGDLMRRVSISRERFHFPARFYTAALVGGVGVLLFLNVDILLVKHYLDPHLSGEYALLALMGKMIFFFGALPSSLIITLVGRSEGRRKNSRLVFLSMYLLTYVIVAGVVLGLWLFGESVLPWIFGEKVYALLPYLDLYAVGLGFFTLGSVISTYYLARRQYVFSLVTPLTALIMGGAIMLNHGNLEAVAVDVALSGILTWVILQLLDVFESKLRFVQRGLRDLVDMFVGAVPVLEPMPVGQRRILIFNWRDTRHRYAGGAEEYVHEIAREWVCQGHSVTQFSGNDGQSPRHETVDGVKVVRRGGFYLVYPWAFLYYMLRFRGRYDVIIDCQNGVPFFAPVYAKEPVYCLIHHVHQEVFFRDLIKPLALLASWLEKDLMPFVYRNVEFITVSESSRREMELLGLGQAGIRIVHPGVHLQDFVASKKSLRPTVLYLGRLKAYKSIDVLLRAFRQVINQRPEAKLLIAGSGEQEWPLRQLARELGLREHHIQFLGRVSEAEKIRLLQESWVLVNPSFMEGWGMVMIEANACGTPVIASDVPGLRDSVKYPEAGYLVPYGDSPGFARQILKIIKDKQLRDKMGTEARVWAENFQWKKSSQEFFMAISRE